MTKTDKLFGYSIFGFIIFVTCFCLGWWLCYLLNSSVKVVMIGSIIGMLVGIILDVILLRTIVKDMFKLKYYWLIILYVIYSIGTLGFFMGVPLFNVLLGLFAGYYIGRRAKVEKNNNKDFLKKLQITNTFCLLILSIVCIISGSLALTDPYTSDNIKGMFNLSFDISNGLIWTITIVGGLSLLVIQYLLTNIIAKKIYIEDVK